MVRAVAARPRVDLDRRTRTLGPAARDRARGSAASCGAKDFVAGSARTSRRRQSLPAAETFFARLEDEIHGAIERREPAR